MESKVTALEMRRKFGGILDRVAKKGDHITIMRGDRPLATIIPAQEHEDQCLSRDRIQTVEEVLAKIARWQKRNKKKLKEVTKISSEEKIRRMRDSRWSSLTHPSP